MSTLGCIRKGPAGNPIDAIHCDFIRAIIFFEADFAWTLDYFAHIGWWNVFSLKLKPNSITKRTMWNCEWCNLPLSVLVHVHWDAELDSAGANAMDSIPEIVRHTPCISCIFRHDAFENAPYTHAGSNIRACNFSADIFWCLENAKLPFQNQMTCPASQIHWKNCRSHRLPVHLWIEKFRAIERKCHYYFVAWRKPQNLAATFSNMVMKYP